MFIKHNIHQSTHNYKSCGNILDSGSNVLVCITNKPKDKSDLLKLNNFPTEFNAFPFLQFTKSCVFYDIKMK